MISVPIDRTYEDWRNKARDLLGRNLTPDEVHWQTAGEFPMGESYSPQTPAVEIRLPPEFLRLAPVVSAYRDDTTWALLYRVAWRILHENRKLLHITVDPDIRDLEARRHSVSRDLHKMHAFVRFREVPTEDGPVYMAWHRPDHRITRLAAGFFQDRFNGMKWVIMTEDETIAWDLKNLSFLPGAESLALPEDSGEELWKTYYSAIFNPARVKVSMMKKEMAVRYWGTLPEAQLIDGLLADAPRRIEEFAAFAPQPAQVSAPKTLGELHAELAKCRACGICPQATAPVPGTGPSDARVAFVGEQPGDFEDRAGLPFVGPAGEVLMETFKMVGIQREEVFLTNAVKGFKWVKGYLDRQHRTASAREIATCRPWVHAELKLVKPEILVCLGRTAAQSILGKMVKLEEVRGEFFSTPLSAKTIILPHPASILRTPDLEEKQHNLERFQQEMMLVKQASLQ
jgi:probable DNA metabolism protein